MAEATNRRITLRNLPGAHTSPALPRSNSLTSRNETPIPINMGPKHPLNSTELLYTNSGRPKRESKPVTHFNPSAFDPNRERTRTRSLNGSGGSGGSGEHPVVEHRYATRRNRSAVIENDDMGNGFTGPGGIVLSEPYEVSGTGYAGDHNGDEDAEGDEDVDAEGEPDVEGDEDIEVVVDSPEARRGRRKLRRGDSQREGADEMSLEVKQESLPTQDAVAPYIDSATMQDLNQPSSQEAPRQLRSRNKNKNIIVDSDYEEEEADAGEEDEEEIDETYTGRTRRAKGRPTLSNGVSAQDTGEGPRRSTRVNQEMKDFVHNDEDDEEMGDENDSYEEGPRRSTRNLRRKEAQEQLIKKHRHQQRQQAQTPSYLQPKRPTMRMTRNSAKHMEEGIYISRFDNDGVPVIDSKASIIIDEDDEHPGPRRGRRAKAGPNGLEDGMATSDEGGGGSFDAEVLDPSDKEDPSATESGRQGRKYSLRKTKQVNYAIPALPPQGIDGSFFNEPTAGGATKSGKKKKRGGGTIFDGLPVSLRGKDYDKLFGVPGANRDDSDEDGPLASPRKPSLFAGAAGGGQGVFAGGFDMTGGAPNNLGRVSGAQNLADTDPLSSSSAPTFQEVGGLQHHIQQLKEMVSLPLLYPEVFQRFNITPPRGVLFYGPPGTGKTLVARALAASCCGMEGQKVAFFMRKGADCLSKWVGEAERQLRLLFEEAKASQPSIIFFDEIDGLAPVRSSKQEQIHASIVSTLLALMDGMDGRGQVVIIGATNRPDAIDPALRRPGRFDREFYFPLPNKDARKSIIGIHTKGWDPPLEENFVDELSSITKGYGGADLRALCTEAALNAIQRKYPQVYKSPDRLQIDPQSISVSARDFVISQKNLVPSSARSTASTAVPLPEHLQPLLNETLDRARSALAKSLPDVKKINVLEEAEYEDDSTIGGFEREKMRQAFETARIFRPRMLILGPPGMGQSYVASAILHHLEGFHVATLDLGTLLGDSTRTAEAACVQIFTEAKRHKPSIIFLPSLSAWEKPAMESARSTIKSLLDGLDPSDPVLLLGVVDGPLTSLPIDVRSWFGFVKANRLELRKPNDTQRDGFFGSLFENLCRAPNELPDGMPRKKRILEELPKAPPPPPRQLTAAELEQQRRRDAQLREALKWRLSPILAELKKRYKKFLKPFTEEAQQLALQPLGVGAEANQTPHRHEHSVPRFYNIDLEQMHYKLYYDHYLEPEDFIRDIKRIRKNAELDGDGEYIVKAGQMDNHVHVAFETIFDEQFTVECKRMSERAKERLEKEKVEAKRSKKGKEKAKENTLQSYPSHNTRYGTRQNGSAELVVEDITALERRLKRQRNSDEDGNGEAVKKARMGSSRATSTDVATPNLLPEQRQNGLPNGLPVPFNLTQPAMPSFPLDSNLSQQPPDFTSTEIPQNAASNGIVYSPPPGPPPDHLTSMAVAAPPVLQLSPPRRDERFQTPASFPTSPTRQQAQPEQGTTVFQSPPHGLQMPRPYHGASPLRTMNLISTSGALPASSGSFLNPFSSAPPSQESNAPAQPQSAILTSVEPITINPSAPINEPSFAMNVDPASSPSAPILGGVDDDPNPEPSAHTPTLVAPAPEPRAPTPLPEFVLDKDRVELLRLVLVSETSPLNVDQLVQLRAGCFDLLWTARQDWNRNSTLDSMKEYAEEFVEEVKDMLTAEQEREKDFGF